MHPSPTPKHGQGRSPVSALVFFFFFFFGAASAGMLKSYVCLASRSRIGSHMRKELPSAQGAKGKSVEERKPTTAHM